MVYILYVSLLHECPQLCILSQMSHFKKLLKIVRMHKITMRNLNFLLDVFLQYFTYNKKFIYNHDRL